MANSSRCLAVKNPAHAAHKTPLVNIEKRFQIISKTSQGSMSKVYKAFDTKINKTVCLKVQDADKQAAATARATHSGRVIEGEILEKLVHPKIVKHYEHGDTTTHAHFLSMEFVDGQSVRFLKETYAITFEERLDVLLQAAEGLAYVHSHGFLHHDFGPRNLIVNGDRQLKLIDFGLAVPNTPDFRRPGNRTGTLDYMAPELLRREPIDVRIDIFSFGVTAYELMTDRLPYEHATTPTQIMQRLNHDPVDPALANPYLPEDVVVFLKTITARRKEDRFATMDQVISALRPLCETYPA